MRRASVLNAADPGRIRLRSAAATTFSLLLAIGAMLAFTRAAGQPVTVAMLGAVVAMQASAAVKDRDQRSRNITTLLLFFPAIGAMALAAFLAPHGKIVDVGFIAVLFAAVWVRRYGPRGNALGMVAFISYFFVMFLRTPVHQIPVLAVAVAVGIASSLLVHVLLFPERPRVEARRLLSALRAASLSTLDVATRRGQVSVDVARHELDQLGETALLIDDWLDRYEAAKSLSVTSKDLALRVFEAQIMLEQAASFLWWLDQDEPWPEGLVDAVAALRICLDNNPTEEQLRQARRMGAAAGGQGRPVDLGGRRDGHGVPGDAGTLGDSPHHHQRPRHQRRRHRRSRSRSRCRGRRRRRPGRAVGTGSQHQSRDSGRGGDQRRNGFGQSHLT